MTSQSMFALRAFGVFVLCGSTTALPALADVSHGRAAHATATASTTSMKSAGPRKANGSGIEVLFRIDGTARIGETLPVTLGFSGVVARSGASVRFEADAGLELAESYKTAIALTQSDAASSFTVPVMPTAEGLAYLHVFTTQQGVTSVSSIPVQTGNFVPAKPRGDLQPTPDGDVVRTLPVR